MAANKKKKATIVRAARAKPSSSASSSAAAAVIQELPKGRADRDAYELWLDGDEAIEAPLAKHTGKHELGPAGAVSVIDALRDEKRRDDAAKVARFAVEATKAKNDQVLLAAMSVARSVEDDEWRAWRDALIQSASAAVKPYRLQLLLDHLRVLKDNDGITKTVNAIVALHKKKAPVVQTIAEELLADKKLAKLLDDKLLAKLRPLAAAD